MSLFERIRSELARAIRSGAVAEGQILIEGRIAELFGTSRAPVRKALQLLNDEGLAHRFRGRGYIAGSSPRVAPVRQPLDIAIGGEDGAGRLRTRQRGDVVLENVLKQAAIAIAFGEFRINQSALAEHFGMNRAHAAGILMRLRDQRLVWQDERGHWCVGPLTARAVRDEYEIRALLEPVALRQSAGSLREVDIDRMRERVRRLIASPDPALAEVIGAERDLHDRCLSHAQNARILSIIQGSQLSNLVDSVFLGNVGTSRALPELQEHLVVLDCLAEGQAEKAADALAQHLFSAGRRTTKRLKSLSVLPEPEFPPYLIHP